MKHAERDADLAERLEREAEATNDPSTWAVAHDAWEERGEPERAWYAFLRSRGYGDPAVTYERVIEWAARLRLYDESANARQAADRENRPMAYHGGGYLDRDLADEISSRLELFQFMTEQPRKQAGFDNGGDSHVVTFMSGVLLGRIVHRGKIRTFGNGSRIASVRVAGVNGFTYSGSCVMGNGTYRGDHPYRERVYKLRRGKPWLR